MVLKKQTSSSSLLSKIFPLELFSCRSLRIHAKEREMEKPSIEVFQMPASYEHDDESKITPFSSDIRGEFSRKWMSFERENSTYKKSLSCRNWQSFTEFSEANMTKENKNDVLSSLQRTFVVSDATKPDCPIMFASDGFLVMTGYTAKEVIGRNCRFLQGPETDEHEVAKIREAIRKGNSYCGKLLNYKKNGTPFWNLLTVGPVKDSHGKIIKYIGMQIEISKHTKEKEKAIGSNTEVQTLKSIRPYVQSNRRETDRKHEEQEIIKPDYALPKAVGDENISTHDNQNSQLDCINDLPHFNSYEDASMKSRVSDLSTGFKERPIGSVVEHEEKKDIKTTVLKYYDIEFSSRKRHTKRESGLRQGIDLATTLERIEESFVITNPRLPDNPIIFASERFLGITEYTREEVLGRNFWFLQGSETDQATVSKIRDAIEEQREITVQIIIYSKSGKKLRNLFHLQPMCDQKGELQYFIGVQLDVEPTRDRPSVESKCRSAKLVKAVAEHVDKAVCELPDANLKPNDLWAIYCKPVLPRPHKKYNSSWAAIKKITSHGEKLGLHHFEAIKPLGFGGIGSVHLVELKGTGELFAMKAIEKSVILNRNKVHRVCMEREIISLLDHPFLPTLYSSFQTPTHVCLITDFCAGGDLFAFLDKQSMKMFKEEAARFYAAEIVIGLEYLHCLGIIYRDLKPENVLLQKDGHIVLTDFDLSVLTSQVQDIESVSSKLARLSRSKSAPPVFVAEPVAYLNSFVGTEDYIAPEIIMGLDHNSSIDWWTLGILLYEMLYGRTPFKGKNREKTFANILGKDLTFPFSIQVSLAARQFIDALLQRDPNRRLGSRTGADEIKRHPFFRGINWPKIRCMTPPSSDVALQLIEKASKSNDLKWGDKVNLFF